MIKFRLLMWMVIFLFVFAACTQSESGGEQAFVEATQPAGTAVPVATAVPAEPTSTATEAPAEIKPEVEATTDAESSGPLPTPTLSNEGSASQARLIMDEPIFTGGDLQFMAWSPNGRYLAYFEYTEEQVAESPVEGLRGTYPGTFVFYDSQTGEKCTDYPFSGLFNYEGGGNGSRWLWLPNGQLLLNLPEGQLVQTDAPCEPGVNIAASFPNTITSIGALSPNEQWLILEGGGQYWLYNLIDQNAHPIADVQTDSFNNLVWSPDSLHISITLAGNYTGDRSPIGGTRLIDVATGEIIARHDWEPANALDGTFGGPVWINNDEFVVTLSLDQGPFLMNLDGEVQPLLPLLFDETFNRDNYWPPLDVYADVENGRYAILRSNEGREGAAKLYISTPDGESLEILDNPAFVYRIFPDGSVGYDGNGRYFSRSPFETDAPFTELVAGANPWVPDEYNLHVAANGGTVTVFDRTKGELVDRFQLAGYEQGFILNPLPSPNEQWLAIFVNESRYSLGRALFVLPLSSN